jgi:hypothetical protein
MHRTKHNMTHSPEYRAWDGMWRRCTNPKHKSYHLYKDRAPPEEWRDFSVFYAEIGPKPAPGYSVDRIDNDKPYGPGNVRWTTDHVQARNKTTNIWTLTPDGQRLILTDSCRLLGLDYEKVKFRRWMGESIEDASNGLLKAA